MKKFLRRFSSAVSPQVFATSLESLLARDQVLDPEATVPTILREFVRFLSTEKALATEGIFRLAGSGKAVKDIRERIEKTGVVNFSDVSDADISAVASLFKQWIRELPEALIPETFYDKIMQSAGSSEDLRLTLSTLPPLHLKCIRYLFRYLLKVSANEDLNKMSISNLSVVFAINVFRCPSEPRLQPPGGGLSTADQASYFAETLVVTKVMSFLLENYSSVFGADDEDLFKDDRRAMQAAATQKAGQEEAAQQKILQSREAPDLDSDNNSDSGSVSSMDSAPRSSFEGSPRLERSMLSKLMNRKRGNTVGEKSKAASTDAVVGRARSSSDPRLLSNQDILAREIKTRFPVPTEYGVPKETEFSITNNLQNDGEEGEASSASSQSARSSSSDSDTHALNPSKRVLTSPRAAAPGKKKSGVTTADTDRPLVETGRQDLKVNLDVPESRAAVDAIKDPRLLPQVPSQLPASRPVPADTPHIEIIENDQLIYTQPLAGIGRDSPPHRPSTSSANSLQALNTASKRKSVSFLLPTMSSDDMTTSDVRSWNGGDGTSNTSQYSSEISMNESATESEIETDQDSSVQIEETASISESADPSESEVSDAEPDGNGRIASRAAPSRPAPLPPGPKTVTISRLPDDNLDTHALAPPHPALDQPDTIQASEAGETKSKRMSEAAIHGTGINSASSSPGQSPKLGERRRTGLKVNTTAKPVTPAPTPLPAAANTRPTLIRPTASSANRRFHTSPPTRPIDLRPEPSALPFTPVTPLWPQNHNNETTIKTAPADSGHKRSSAVTPFIALPKTAPSSVSHQATRKVPADTPTPSVPQISGSPASEHAIRAEIKTLYHKIKDAKAAGNTGPDLHANISRYRELQAMLKKLSPPSPAYPSTTPITPAPDTSVHSLPASEATAEINALKQQIANLKGQSKAGGAATAEQKAQIRELYGRYCALNIYRQSQSIPESSKAPSETSTSPSDQDEFLRLKYEKKLLQMNLHQYQEDFLEKHGRPLKTSEDRAPVEDDYARYKELKCRLSELEDQRQSGLS